MSNITEEIRIIQLAARGEEVRDALIDALLGIESRTNLTVDEELSGSSENPVQNKAIYEALEGKQETLIIDSAPARESENPISSGAVFEALAGKQDGIRLAAIELSDSWSGGNPFTQAVSLTGVTANSKVDLQPDAQVLAVLLRDGATAIWVQNDNGALTACVMGGAPTEHLTIQCTVTEV